LSITEACDGALFARLSCAMMAAASGLAAAGYHAQRRRAPIDVFLEQGECVVCPVRIAVSALLPIVVLCGCAAPVKTAQNKSVEVEGQKLDFGGTYLPRDRELTLTVNGDPVLRGRFPPYTPTQKLTGTYKNLPIAGDCYFGSVLGTSGGITGIVAGAVQGTRGKSADKCDISVNGKPVESLYF
jgi:hypothetical protein